MEIRLIVIAVIVLSTNISFGQIVSDKYSQTYDSLAKKSLIDMTYASMLDYQANVKKLDSLELFALNKLNINID